MEGSIWNQFSWSAVFMKEKKSQIIAMQINLRITIYETKIIPLNIGMILNKGIQRSFRDKF